MPNIPITTTLDDTAIDRLIASLNMLDARGKAAFSSLGQSAQIAEAKVLKLAAANQLAQSKLGISTVSVADSRNDMTALSGVQSMLNAQTMKGINSFSQWGAQLQRTGTQMRQTGMNLSMGLTVPIVALGAVSLVTASKFERSMSQIFSQAGATREEVASLTPKVLELAKSTEQGPAELAKSLFEVESVGFRAGSAMEVLRVAAMGATTGQADLTKVTIAMTGAMVSGIEGTESALGTMATINAIVGTSRMHMEEFASSLSSGILPVSNNLGLSLSEVGGALGTLSDMGVPVQEAATRLRTTLGLIAAPGAQARDVLEGVGITHDQLAEKMRSGGLVGMIELLREKLAGYSDTARFAILSGAFGGARSGSVLQTLMSDEGFKTLKEKESQIGAGSGIQTFVDAYIEQTKTLEFRWGRFVSNFQVNAIKLSKALEPVASAFMGILGPAITFIVDKFTSLDPKIQKLIVGFLVVAAVIGPVMIFMGAIISATGVVLTALGLVSGGWLVVAASAMAAFVAENLALLGIPALIIGVVAALGLLIYKWDQVKKALSGIDKKNIVFAAVVFPFAPILAGLALMRGKWDEAWEALPRPVQVAIAKVVNPVINGVNRIIDVLNVLIVIGAIVFAPLTLGILAFIAAFNFIRNRLAGFAGVLGSVGNAWLAVWAHITGLFPGFMGTAMDAVVNVFRNALNKMLDFLPGWASKAAGWFGAVLGKAGEVGGILQDMVPQIGKIGNLEVESRIGGRGVSEERLGIQAQEEQRRKDYIATMQFFSGFQIPDFNGMFPDDSGGLGYSPDSGEADKLNKTEYGLLALADAFKIFNEQTGSDSVDAFKTWLDLQERIVEAQAQQNVRMEQARNPMLAMTMALGAIRAHILEANISIEQFLTDEVYRPALNAFKSALDSLFSRPSKELQSLQLQKLQAERQKMLDQQSGAGKKRLEADDKVIERINQQIALLDNQNAIAKLQAEMKDQTIQTEQQMLDQSVILGDMISKASTDVNRFGGAAFFLALTTINLGNALNEQAAIIRGAGGASAPVGGAVGGPFGGQFSIMNEGNSGSSELVKLPTGSFVFTASQSRKMMGGGGGYGDISINLSLQGSSKEQIKSEVLKALDNALVSAELGGGFGGGGSYLS